MSDTPEATAQQLQYRLEQIDFLIGSKQSDIEDLRQWKSELLIEMAAIVDGVE
jgi:hypothetical protein